MAKFLEAPQDLYAPLLDEAYKRRMAVAQQLMRAREQAGTGSVPVGIAQLGTAAIEGLLEKKAHDDALDQQNEYLDGVRKTEGAGLGAVADRLKSFGGGTPVADAGPVPGAPSAPSQTFANSIGFTPDPSGVSGDSIRATNNAKAMASDDSLDKVVRTVYGEASNQGDLGEKAVAAVIMNRAKQANMDPRDVVLAKNQFEPWSDPKARERMLTLDPNSPEYRQALANVLAAQQGDDPTGGATHFYAPKAQAALGRSAPSWDNGTGVDIGDHRFFKLGYKGGGPNGTEALAQPQPSPQGQGVRVASNDPSIGTGSAQPQQPAPGGIMVAQADQAAPLQAPQTPLPPMPGLPEGIDPNKLVPNFAARAATAQQFLANKNPRIVLTGQKMAQQLQQEATEALKLAESRGYDLRLFQYKHGVEQRDKVSEENRTHAWDATKTNQQQGFEREQTGTKFGNDVALADRQSINRMNEQANEHRLSAMDPTTDIKEFQFSEGRGEDPGQFKQYQINNKRAGATIIDQRAQNAEDQARGAGLGKRLNDIADDGIKAQDDMAVVQRMQGLFNNVEPGAKTAALEGLRQMTGITLDPNTDNVQAARSIVDYLTPRMRVAGSGSSSDKDMNAFKGAMPQLLATPGGNDLVIGTLGGMHQLRLERAKIAEMWQAGDITGKEASQRIRDLDKMDPFAKFKEWQTAQKSDQPGSVTTTEQPPVPNARKAGDGNWYVPDPKREGKYLRVQP